MKLDPHLLAGVMDLRLAAPLAAGKGAGERRSRAVGQGLEFADHRAYLPGDDLRRVDWNAYARHEAVLVRLYQEGRNLRALLSIDATGSMGTGAPSKLWYAGEVALALAAVGLKQRDRLRIGCFGAAKPAAPVIASHPGHLHAVLHHLQAAEPGTTCDARQALLAQAEQHRWDLAFVLSDLLAEEEEVDGLLRAMAAVAGRPYLLHVLSREDLAPDLSEAAELVDAETRARLRLPDTRDLAAAWPGLLQRWLDGIRRRCADYGVRYVLASTDTPPLQLLRTHLRRAGAVEAA